MLFYFDSLPSHAQPSWLESLTSYVTRLARGNHMYTVDALTAVGFPTSDRRVARELEDYPPLSLDSLSMVAACPVPSLLATTFHYLALKFGRSSSPQPLSRFLRGSVSAHLRYCPDCVAEHHYYSLTWRFLMLEGCVRHGCRLLDKCSSCNQPIRLLSAPFEIAKCSSCRADIGQHKAPRLHPAERRKVLERFFDIVFLLSPRVRDDDDRDAAKYVGRRLGTERRLMSLMAAEMAERIGVSLSEVEGIERGNVTGRGASFSSYVRYMSQLGMTMRDIFASVSGAGNNASSCEEYI